MVKARKLVYSRKHDYTCIYELSHRPISKGNLFKSLSTLYVFYFKTMFCKEKIFLIISVEAQVLPDNNGVKRHYSTGDMLNEKGDLQSRRPKSEGFNQSMYRVQQINKKRYSFGVSWPFLNFPFCILHSLNLFGSSPFHTYNS